MEEGENGSTQWLDFEQRILPKRKMNRKQCSSIMFFK